MGYEEEDPFDVVMFGYDRTQVDAFVEEIQTQEQSRKVDTARLPQIEAELGAAHEQIARLQKENARLTADLTLNQPSIAASTRLQQMLRLAEEEAVQIRHQADAVLKEAMTRAENITRQAREDANLAAAKRRGDQSQLVKPVPDKEPVHVKSPNGSKRSRTAG